MEFEEWADRTFGSNFIDEEPITYFRMASAFEAGEKKAEQQREELLEALKGFMVEFDNPFCTSYDLTQKAQILREAISKAEGLTR